MAALKPFFVKSKVRASHQEFSFLIVFQSMGHTCFIVPLSLLSSLSGRFKSYLYNLYSDPSTPISGDWFCCFIFNLVRDLAELFYLNWFSLQWKPLNCFSKSAALAKISRGGVPFVPFPDLSVKPLQIPMLMNFFLLRRVFLLFIPLFYHYHNFEEFVYICFGEWDNYFILGFQWSQWNYICHS